MDPKQNIKVDKENICLTGNTLKLKDLKAKHWKSYEAETRLTTMENVTGE